MSSRIVVWDADDTIYKGRGTTHLSAASKMPPEYFIRRFEGECGKPRTPLSDISPSDFRAYLAKWEIDNKQKIKDMKTLGTALTDLRHVYGLFDIRHTKYTKNAILEGISMLDVETIMSDVPRNSGFDEAAQTIKANNVIQTIFSNASYPIPVCLGRWFKMDHVDGLPTYVKDGEQERLYTPEDRGKPEVKFTGKLFAPNTENPDEDWEKVKPFLDWIETQDVEQVFAIDDDNLDMLQAVQSIGGTAIGYQVKEKGIPAFRERRIPRLKNPELTDFAQIVLGKKRLLELCEI